MDAKGVVQKEIVPPDQNDNVVYKLDVLKKLREKIRPFGIRDRRNQVEPLLQCSQPHQFARPKISDEEQDAWGGGGCILMISKRL